MCTFLIKNLATQLLQSVSLSHPEGKLLLHLINHICDQSEKILVVHYNQIKRKPVNVKIIPINN